MNNEQEIEKIIDILFDSDGFTGRRAYEATTMAKDLINAGIGDKKEAVKEFITKFKDEFYIILNEVLGSKLRTRLEVKQECAEVLKATFEEVFGND